MPLHLTSFKNLVAKLFNRNERFFNLALTSDLLGNLLTDIKLLVIKKKSSRSFQLKMFLGNGCGSVDRAVASVSRSPQF